MSSINDDQIRVATSQEEEEELCLFAMQLSSASVLPMVLKSVIELNLLELIKNVGPDAFVSPRELAAQLPITNPQAHLMLDRILHLLATYSVLKCRLNTMPEGGVERLYSLAPVCKFLTNNHDGVSMAPQVLLHQSIIYMESWYHLNDAVLKGGVPFNMAHGMTIFERNGTDPSINNVFNLAMSNHSTILMNKFLKTYDGFDGLKSVVDVGGGIAATLNMIISKYPSIKGINYDLPHVIKDAPSYPGVEHVAGDMFVSVPKGDAIFMKWICHDWSDEHCLKLLKNCYEAVPDNGKVILAEYILPESSDNIGLTTKAVAQLDLIMLAHVGGKERTEKEFKALAKASGFKAFHKVCCAYGSWIMELCK